MNYRFGYWFGYTAQNMKFSFKGFFSKCDQIRSFLRIWSLLLKKSLVKNFIFCAVLTVDLDNLSMLSKSFRHECFHVAFYIANVSIWELLHMSFTIFNILDNFQPLTCFIMPSPDMKMLLLYLFSTASELHDLSFYAFSTATRLIFNGVPSRSHRVSFKYKFDS